jgi:Xaa-Pro aminopeptidase
LRQDYAPAYVVSKTRRFTFPHTRGYNAATHASFISEHFSSKEEPTVKRMPRTAKLEEFMQRMEPDSVAIIPGARETIRSNDTAHRYRHSSDLYYLTGFDEPDSIAVIRPGYADGAYTLFVRPHDAEKNPGTDRAPVSKARKNLTAQTPPFPSPSSTQNSATS